MNLTIFTVHDSKAEAYITPFFASNKAVGLRMFEQAANDESAQFHTHAGDYTLFELGTFDQDRGTFDLHLTPINHGLAINYRKATTQEETSS